METTKIIVQVLAVVNLLLSLLMFIRLRQPTSLILWAIKVLTSAISPFLLLIGVLTAILGYILDSSWLLIAMGGFSAILFLLHISIIIRAPYFAIGFKKVFGAKWQKRIPEERKTRFLSKRYVLWLPKSLDIIFETNIPYYTYQDSGRQLLCDVWQPPKHTKPSGLAFIYLHGSAWAVLDKDSGTRKFFRHLASQGHVIMDLAYRLFPETNFMGMVHDTKYAIAWMKSNADKYSVDPERIVLGGASAGGHLSLLSAYTAQNSDFLPKDLEGIDLNVRGVISLYGPTDLIATYNHCRQDLADKKKSKEKKKGNNIGTSAWMQKGMGKQIHQLGFDKDVEPGMLTPMLGGTPDEVPEVYAKFSPSSYVHKECPATLLIQGNHDIITSVTATREFHTRLVSKKVPAVLHVIPQTDHAFDLILPKISPSAHNAMYDIERFLALMV